jgi:hypothetical protein
MSASSFLFAPQGGAIPEPGVTYHVLFFQIYPHPNLLQVWQARQARLSLPQDRGTAWQTPRICFCGVRDRCGESILSCEEREKKKRKKKKVEIHRAHTPGSIYLSISLLFVPGLSPSGYVRPHVAQTRGGGNIPPRSTTIMTTTCRRGGGSRQLRMDGSEHRALCRTPLPRSQQRTGRFSGGGTSPSPMRTRHLSTPPRTRALPHVAHHNKQRCSNTSKATPGGRRRSAC